MGNRRHRAAARPGAAWQPLRRCQQVITPELAAYAAEHPAARAVIADAAEVWANNQYVVIVRRYPAGPVAHLSIRRADRRPARDWRDFMRIKDELAGPEVEAVELYPARSRLVDEANQYHLWCLLPGQELPLGFGQRSVLGPGLLPGTGARQRELGE